MEALEERTLLSYSFSQIADITGILIPFSPGSTRFLPGINSTGTVAYWSLLRPGGQGIFTRDMQGSLGMIAITDDQLQSFASGVQINSAGTVAFLANLRAGGQAIFTGNGGALTRIADTTFGPFSSFLLNAELVGNAQLNDAGTVAFAATLTSGGEGIFTGSGGPPAILYVTGGLFKDFLPTLNVAINQAGTVSFLADLTAGGRGVFKGNGGPPTAIADTRDGIFRDFSSANTRLNDQGTVAFRAAFTAGGQAILTGDGGPLTVVASTGGVFSSFDFQPGINNSGTVIFEATLTAGGRGLFSGPDPIADRIIGPGDPLFGSTVTNVNIVGKGLNDAGQLAFIAHLADGRALIVRADPIPPEPPPPPLGGGKQPTEPVSVPLAYALTVESEPELRSPPIQFTVQSPFSVGPSAPAQAADSLSMHRGALDGAFADMRGNVFDLALVQDLGQAF